MYNRIRISCYFNYNIVPCNIMLSKISYNFKAYRFSFYNVNE